MTEPDGCCHPCDNEEHDLCENPLDGDQCRPCAAWRELVVEDEVAVVTEADFQKALDLAYKAGGKPDLWPAKSNHDHEGCDPDVCFTAKLRYMRKYGANLVVPRGFGAN